MPKPHTPRSAARAFSIILCPTNSGQPYRFSLSPPLAYDDKANFPSGRGDDGQPSSAWDTPLTLTSPQRASWALSFHGWEEGNRFFLTMI